MPEQMAPRQPSWYASPEEIDVKVQEIEQGPFPEEIAILVNVVGGSKTALVPASAVDLDKKTVTGLIIGEIAGMVLVALPPSSMGKTILQMSQDSIKELTLPG